MQDQLKNGRHDRQTINNLLILETAAEYDFRSPAGFLGDLQAHYSGILRIISKGTTGPAPPGWTDAFITTVRYGCARRIDHQLATGGNNPANNYTIAQLDSSWGF